MLAIIIIRSSFFWTQSKSWMPWSGVPCWLSSLCRGAIEPGQGHGGRGGDPGQGAAPEVVRHQQVHQAQTIMSCGKAQTKSSPDCKYFVTLCRLLFWANLSQLYALNWSHLTSRSDANTALDVLAENLSVYKVGRVVLASYQPQKGYDKIPKVKPRIAIKNFWGKKYI